MKILKLPLELTTGVAIILSACFSFIGLVTYLAAIEAIATIATIAVWFLFGGALTAIVIIGLDRVQWFLVRRAEYQRDRSLAESAGRQARIMADKEQMKLMFEGRMMAATVRLSEQGLLHPGQVGGVPMLAYPRQVVNEVEAQAQLAAPIDNSLVYENLTRKALASRGAGRFIVYGGMDGGKTTLAKHTISYAADQITRDGGQIFVIDPHAPQTVWSDHVSVIGGGLDYDSIANFLDWLIVEVKRRYEAGCGDDQQPLPAPFKKIFIICEEWSGIIASLQVEKRWTTLHNKMLYQDARKAGIGYFLVTHEYTVNSLGLQGMGNLLNGVEYFITLQKDPIRNVHQAKIGTSFKDKAPYNLITPGPFNGPLFYSKAEAEEERSKIDKYLTFDDLRFVVAEPKSIRPKPKHHADNVNAVIDQFLADDPETFPTKGQISAAVGITGGSKYPRVIETYEKRFSQWNV